MTIEVLDKGHVQLVDHMGTDLTVVNAARVSFSKESEWEFYGDCDHGGPSNGLSNKDTKLIQYLAKKNHWTPFAHPQITLRVKAPIFVRTQLFKHKQGFVENEESRRYIDSDPQVYFPECWRSRPEESIKQGSGDVLVGSHSFQASKELRAAYVECWSSYRLMVGLGVAPEQARMVLPQSTYTEWWWTGSLAAYARVYKQRTDSTAQWETQQYAKTIGEIIQPLFPESWKALTQ